MAIKEFYIRNADETDSRGPFSLEQMSSLAETGQVTPATLFYEPQNEQWVAIQDDPEVKALLFPEKKRLVMKKDAQVPTLNKQSDTSAPIDVTDMLAAAEGRTQDTADKSEHLVMADRCAKFGLYGCTVMLILAAAAEILPSIEVLTAFSPEKLLGAPLLILGVLDVFLAILLLLGVVASYPLIRFRAMLGLGLMGFLFYCQGQTVELTAAICGSIGLYLCTAFLSYAPIFLGLLLGVGGMAGLAFLLIF